MSTDATLAPPGPARVTAFVIDSSEMDYAWPTDLLRLRDEAAAVGAVAAADLAIREDSWVRGSDREFSLELGRRGWLGMTWPVEYGGGGRSPLERFVVTEQLIAAGAPVARSWVADRQIGPILLNFGTNEQRRRYLPDMLEGAACWSLGMSEPDAGSDLASLTTRAIRDGDQYVINGRKIWTTFGLEASHCYLIARTDPDAPRHRGLSEFIVDMNLPGISVAGITDMTGEQDFCEVTYDDVRVSVDDLVGQPGDAFHQVMRQLEHERAGIDRLVSNRALYLDARDQADTSDPRLRQVIGRIEARYFVARLMVLRDTLGQGASQAAATKVFCTELEQEIADFAGRVFGAGALLVNRVSRAICYAPAYSIQGGTSDILRNVIAERVLGLPR